MGRVKQDTLGPEGGLQVAQGQGEPLGFSGRPPNNTGVSLGPLSGQPPDPGEITPLMGLSEIGELMGFEKEEMTLVAETALEILENRSHAKQR